MKEYEFTQATVSSSEAGICFIWKISHERFSVLKAIDMMRVVVASTRAPIPMGNALKTYFRSGRKFRRANIPININLKPFSPKPTSPAL